MRPWPSATRHVPVLLNCRLGEHLRERAYYWTLFAARDRHRFEAELVAIAGVYAVADQIKNAKSGEATQAYLHNGKLVIEPLN